MRRANRLDVSKVAITRLSRIAGALDNQRSLRELSFAFADIAEVPVSALRWDEAVIDRTNARWGELKRLARLLLKGQYQTTSQGRGQGSALLFEMNVLFEEYVGRMLIRALSDEPVIVRRQSGGRYCLIERDETGQEGTQRFLTRPDLIVSRDGFTQLIIDTKWKRLSAYGDHPKQGVSQADVYQMMAYGRLYDCAQLMLLYPHRHGLGLTEGIISRHRVGGGEEILKIATVTLGERNTFLKRLKALVDIRQKMPSP
jgi:5-methylcytosine-specific restriction enzyme subunit McrC